MDRQYHDALVREEIDGLQQAISANGWSDVSFVRSGASVFVSLPGKSRLPLDKYVARIDLAAYPVLPYSVGFVDPDLPPAEWDRAHVRDPRFWPFSAMPGLQGSFNIAHPGPHRVFWCRPCTLEYFYYHGDQVWDPGAWPLYQVVSYLREAVQLAEHPRQWRPVQREQLLGIARANGIHLPEDAGLDNA